MQFRIFRFGAVGLVSTGILASSLLVLATLTQLDSSLANLASFSIAFGFSIKAQQAFTFSDRLGRRQLNGLALTILFSVNAILAISLGHLLDGWWRSVLPLVPAAINYILMYIATGLPLFRS